MKTVLRIEPWRGVWRVTQDEKFYGDYKSRVQAMEGIAALTQEVRRNGGEIVMVDA